jgi:hypothetical protein
MKKITLLILGKVIIWISPLLWKSRFRWAFHLHQWLGRKVINWHHKYKIDILD